ncbi:MAG: TonB family protein [Bacteriovoracaceae bacterium]|nr:TonB family protein [Bacteriovoracaceae bacterium]
MIQTLQKPFSFYTKRSLTIHSVLIIVAIIVSYVQWSSGEEQRKLNVKLVQSSVRVDIVAMPKRTFQELKALQSVGQTAPQEAAKEEAPVKEPETNTGKEFLKEKEKVSFTDLMKQYSKKPIEKVAPKEIKGKSKNKENLDSKTLAKLDGLIKRGNRVSKGEALVGSGSAESLTLLQEYASKLPTLVKPFWKLPSYLLDKGLQCRIRVYINARGDLIKAEIFEKSKDNEYDDRALNAIRSAAPFPPPSGEIKNRTLKGDILLGFPL